MADSQMKTTESANPITETKTEAPSDGALLSIRNLRTWFHTDEGIVKAVDDVSFDIKAGEALGVVGESGSGKSVTALSVLKLIQTPPGEYAGGSVLFRGKDILKFSEKSMRDIRGNDIAMIFQDPMTSLNPVMTVGNQICESLIVHRGMKKREAWDHGIEMLKLVGIPLPDERMRSFPFQMSGGMRQRIMIAMALSCNPSLLIADEPTTALDVTIQAQILELIKKLQDETGMAVWMITHDLGVVAETCSRVVVMYGGIVMEEGTVEQVFTDPQHPYTRGLLKCLPRIDEKTDRLNPISGQPPNLAALPPGCPFVDRCDMKHETKHGESHCRQHRPDEIYTKGNRRVRCFLFSEE
jgi:oligopeptide/dipeptide ABC transporter ATP-binding protein